MIGANGKRSIPKNTTGRVSKSPITGRNASPRESIPVTIIMITEDMITGSINFLKFVIFSPKLKK
jgi:hypothetical protein